MPRCGILAGDVTPGTGLARTTKLAHPRLEQSITAIACVWVCAGDNACLQTVGPLLSVSLILSGGGGGKEEKSIKETDENEEPTRTESVQCACGGGPPHLRSWVVCIYRVRCVYIDERLGGQGVKDY